MTPLSLCMSLLLTSGLDSVTAHRGCDMSQELVQEAERINMDPKVLAAIAWQESKFNRHVIGSSGECGAMQVLPKYSGLTCKELQGQPGIAAGAYALQQWKRRHGSLRKAIYHYNCGNKEKKRCELYTKAVLHKLSLLKKS